MDKIIKKLNSEFLESWGFTFDGVNWIHKNYTFSLTASNKEGTYMVNIPNAEIGQTPPPINSNTGLINLIMVDSVNYIRGFMEGKKFISQTAQGESMAKAMSDYLKFDQKLSFRLVSDQFGRMGLHPDNEYTHTMMSGLECEFRVTMYSYNDPEDEFTELIYFNPECISYNFLSQLFYKNEIKKVEIHDVTNDVWTPYFGTGLPKFSDEQ